MNNKKTILISGIGAVLIIALAVLFIFLPKEKANAPIITGDSGIEVFSPMPSETIASPLKITGRVNGNGWTGFEGQVGTVKLFDDSGKELAMGILTATEEWMKLPVKFESVLWFDYPEAGAGKLVFYNENASGEPARDKTFEVPVKLSKSSSEKTTFNVYFSQQDVSSQACEKVFPYTREVPKTQAVATAAMGELVKGPTDFEVYAGIFTSINKGVMVNSLVIENGVAKIDFNEELQKGVAGSCKVIAIRAQIEQTLKQFSTVKEVVISINGKTEGILQP